LFAIVFAESGLFVGFFLPGDSLLFTAGFLASVGYFDIRIIVVICFLGAVLGDSFGYYFGRKLGPRIFTRQNSIFLNPEHIKRAEEFYETHGTKTIILARFMPVIRTFAPIFAGIGRMHYPTFLSYNVFGGLIWGAGIPALGYYLGNTVPNIDRYIIPIIALIIITSFLPTIIKLTMNRSYRERFFASLRRIWPTGQ
jgi:membrane-associated protein